MAAETGVDKSAVEEMDRHLSGRDASLDAPMTEKGSTLSEIIPSDGPTQEEMLSDLEEKADRAASLELAMTFLDPREHRIIEERHLSDNPTQLKDIGLSMGVTKQRVSQIERRAIKKLKAALEQSTSPWYFDYWVLLTLWISRPNNTYQNWNSLIAFK